MAAHYITWDEKGTHKLHLSVEDYKLQERQKEFEAAESELDDARCRIAAAQKRIEAYDDCEQHNTDTKTGISYTLYGDYYLPDYSLPAEEEIPIGVWGERHKQFLKTH